MKPPKERFIDFIHSREALRQRREEGGGPPFTRDPILANYRFCNINREDDAVTRFIHSRFRVPCRDKSRHYMATQMTYCRIFNEPAVLTDAGLFSEGAIAALKRRKERGDKLFRGAYMMPAHFGGGALEYWLKAIGFVADMQPESSFETNELATLALALQKATGLGPFLANQICTDMRYVPGYGKDYTDWETFVLCGPGTRRGLNRYHGRPVVPASGQKYEAEVLALRTEAAPYCTGLIKQYFRDPNNVANSLCEFDKYERACGQIERGEEVTLRRYQPQLI